jgi:hypothetical protein
LINDFSSTRLRASNSYWGAQKEIAEPRHKTWFGNSVGMD